MKVIYILDVFPKISETFILNEIIAIIKRGVIVEIFSFSRADENVVHESVAQVGKVEYSAKFNFCKVFNAHCELFLNSPRCYLKTFGFAINPLNHVFKLFLTKVPFVLKVKKRQPDILHAHFGKNAADFAMLTHLLTGIPYTFTTHGYDIFRDPPKNYKVKSALAKKHITISQFNKDYLRDKFDIDESKLCVIYSGIDFDRQFPKRCVQNKNVIVSVSRLEDVKGVDFLIQACAKLRDKGVLFKCVIVGDGSKRKVLENLIHRLSLTSFVELVGNKTQDEVFEILATATIKVLSSRSETMGVALMEAMAMGVPVIGPNLNGVPELIEDYDNGFLVAPGDVEGLSERIGRLLLDETMRRVFSEKAYTKVFNKFNLKTETQRLFEIWQY